MTTPADDGKNSPNGDASGAPAKGPGSAQTEVRDPVDDGDEMAGSEPSDGALIEAVRQGSTEAYAQLYERHVSAAYSMARQVAKSAGEADDLVSEAFVRVLDTMRAGSGPNTAFRAYLLTSLRNTAYDRSRRDRKIQLSEDVTETSPRQLSTPFTDPALAGLERSLVSTAFSRLPERWQAVLWHVEIENETPAQVASVFGLTANGVSALAYRAREGLRQEYLQAHLGQLEGPHVARCRTTAERLGAWARSGLSKRENAQVETHLDGCGRCRELAAELADINGGLRVVIAPMVLGAGALGYLSTSASTVFGTGAAAGGAAAGGASAGVAAGANTASSVPRQSVGIAASGTALAATVAFAIALSGNETTRPVAAPPPPPPPAPVAPSKPAPPKATPPRQPQPAPPPPTVPSLTATGPDHPVELVAGGAPTDLPISVRNNGNGVSPPVSVTLSLPRGVAAEPSGSGGDGGTGDGAGGAAEPSGADGAGGAGTPRATTTAPAATQPSSASAAATPSAANEAPAGSTCENIPGGIRCTSTRGLAPGETHVFSFRLYADETATGGTVSANVMAGKNINVSIPTVPVVVRLHDGIQVKTALWHRFPWLASRLEFDVRNTGQTSGRANTIITLPDEVHAIGLPPECHILPAPSRALHCATNLNPGQEFDGSILLKTPPAPDDPDNFPGIEHREAKSPEIGSPKIDPPGTDPEWPFRTVIIPVRAQLGSAADEDPAELRHADIPWPPWFPPHTPVPPPVPEPWFPPHVPEPQSPFPPHEPPSGSRPVEPAPPITEPPTPTPSRTAPSRPEPPTTEPSARLPSATESSTPPPSMPSPSTPAPSMRMPFPLVPSTTEHSPRERSLFRLSPVELTTNDRPHSPEAPPGRSAGDKDG